MNKKSTDRIEVQCAHATAVSTLSLMICISVNTEAFASSADYRFSIDSNEQNCQQINPAYQEVYAFETKSFWINICQQGDVYFYSAEAKEQSLNSIFLTAYPSKDRRGFEAKNGNVSYLVVLPFSKYDPNADLDLPEEAILTIKRNSQLVSIESSLNKYCHQSQIAIAPTNIEPNLNNDKRLATIPLQQDIGWNSSQIQPLNTLPTETFDPNTRFDFYRIDGKLHRLTTCD